MTALDSLLAELDTVSDDRYLGDWLQRNLTLANADAILTRAPQGLIELQRYRHTPVANLVSLAGEREFDQWAARHTQQVVVTILSGMRPPSGWAPGPILSLLESSCSWERLWACSEVLRTQADDAATRAATLRLLSDACTDVRCWAWLCVVRWAENAPAAFLGAIDAAIGLECAELRPVAVWAAWQAKSEQDLPMLLAGALETTAAADALEVASWLGQRAAALAPAIEALFDGDDDDVVDAAVRAFACIAPQRWPRLLECAQERTMATPRQRRGHPVVTPIVVPTRRAGACLTALEELAANIDDEGARAIVALATDERFTAIVGALGERGRAAIPALVNHLATSTGYSRSALHTALGQLGAVEALEAAVHQDPAAAYALTRLGKAAGPVVLRLLESSLDARATRLVLDAVGPEVVDESAIAAIVPHLDSTELFVRLAACAAVARLPCDDRQLVQVASVFASCCANDDPFFCRPYAEAAATLAQVLIDRLGGFSDVTKIRLIEAIGWTGAAALSHIEVLEKLTTCASRPIAAAAALAISRIRNPPPRYRPNQ